MWNATKRMVPRFMAVLMVAMLAISGLLTSAVGAQGANSSTSYVSELSGQSVDVYGAFAITTTDGGSYADGAGETVTIDSDTAYVMVGFFDDTDTPDTTIDLYTRSFGDEYDDFVVLDDGVEGEVAWSIARGISDGEEHVFYISVTPDVVGNVDVMTLMLAPAVDFIASLEDAQYDVTIDGDGIFAEADLDALEATIGGADATPVETTGSGQGTTGGTMIKGGQGTTGSTSSPGSPRSGDQGTSGDVTVSEVTGIEIETGGDWTLTDVPTEETSSLREEAFQIQSGFANGYILFSYAPDAQAALDGFLGGFDTSAQSRQTVAADYQRGVAWSLDRAVLGDGTEVYVYSEVREGLDPDYVVLSAMLAAPVNFADEFTSAQDNILLDGESLFVDVDVNDLEDLLDGGSVATDEPGQTTSGTASEGNENPREHAKLPGKNETGQIGQGNESETGSRDTSSASEVDLSAAGLISDTEYESPQFGVGVSWGANWYIDYSDEDAVTTDPAGGVDSLMLVWDGPDFALMFIDISTADELVPADFVDYWTSDEYVSENVAANGRNLLQRSRSDSGAVMTRDYLDSGEEVIIVKEAILLDNGQHLAIVTLISAPDSFDQLYGEAQDDVEIAGGPGVSTFTLRQIERALDR